MNSQLVFLEETHLDMSIFTPCNDKLLISLIDGSDCEYLSAVIAFLEGILLLFVKHLLLIHCVMDVYLVSHSISKHKYFAISFTWNIFECQSYWPVASFCVDRENLHLLVAAPDIC